ncbi:MAG: hypothetical protein QOD70_1032 [Frankiales bacterium]|jgi:hypothetical protein|nr:hypothetical protein [Frankiales bacterium]MDX6266292.1 hypothetical protein [Frankiales bacterium]
MRVYLPSTLTELRRLLDNGVVGDPPLPGYAVTPALREWYAEGDLEEMEYVVLTLAARASVRLLDADPDAVRRRVVVVAEVPDALVTTVPHVDRAAVKVADPVALRLVQAVHVDDPAAVPDVTVAADAVIEADLGSDDAAFRVEQAEGHELQWYASQEIGPLLELS